MKFLKNLSALLAIFGFFTISSCQHDIDMYVPDNNNVGQILNPSPVQASVSGVVLDQDEQPVAGATVKSGSHTATTDSRGLFRFDNIQMDKYASVVTVEYNGYFKGIRTFSAAEGSSNFVRIKLIQKSLIGTVDAATGGAVTLPNNSVVTLQANSVIIKSSGQAYTGPINVYAANIDPTLADIAQTIPGSFQAVDNNNFRVVLKSYGMLAVQLEGQGGELLQIASGKTAKLRFTVPNSLTSAAPENIPLWSLNESTGLWEEEGTATKTGNSYEGDVAHFSFWNCDQPFAAVFLELNVETNGSPLPNAIVRLTRVNSPGSYSYGYTDSTGHVGGMVFSNEPLLLEVLGNCYEVIYSQTIGPFTQNTNLGTINVTLQPANSLTISGNAVDCSNQPVTSGNAYIYWEGQVVITPINNGAFSVTLTRCNASTAPIEITVEDNVGMQQGNTWTGSVTTSGIVNTGTLTACGLTTQQWIHYEINGGPTLSFIAPIDSLVHSYDANGSLVINNFSANNNQGSVIYFSVHSALSLGTGQTFASLYSTEIEGGNTNLTVLQGSPLNITELGNVGEFIAGNGTVTATSSSGNTYSVHIDFRIRRAY